MFKGVCKHEDNCTLDQRIVYIINIAFCSQSSVEESQQSKDRGTQNLTLHAYLQELH